MLYYLNNFFAQKISLTQTRSATLSGEKYRIATFQSWTNHSFTFRLSFVTVANRTCVIDWCPLGVLFTKFACLTKKIIDIIFQYYILCYAFHFSSPDASFNVHFEKYRPTIEEKNCKRTNY